MLDYIDVILHTPLYLYYLLGFLWQVLSWLPWPSWQQYFGTLVLFIVLYKPRQVMENRWLRKKHKRINTVPSATDHQTAAAVVGEMIHHI